MPLQRPPDSAEFKQLAWWRNVPYLYERFACTPLPQPSSICAVLPSPPYAVCDFRRTNYYFLRDFYSRPLIQRLRRLLAGQTVVHASPPIDVLLSSPREVYLARLEIPHEGRPKALGDDDDSGQVANVDEQESAAAGAPSALGGAPFKEVPRCEGGDIVRRTRGLPIRDAESCALWETPLVHGPYRIDYWHSEGPVTSAVCDCSSCTQWVSLVALKTLTGAVWVFNPQRVFVDPFLAKAKCRRRQLRSSKKHPEEDADEEEEDESSQSDPGGPFSYNIRKAGLTDIQLADAAQVGVNVEFPLNGSDSKSVVEGEDRAAKKAACTLVSRKKFISEPHTLRLQGLTGAGGEVTWARTGGSADCCASYVLACSEDALVAVWFLPCSYLLRGRSEKEPFAKAPLYLVQCGVSSVNSIQWTAPLPTAASPAGFPRPLLNFVTVSHDGFLRLWSEHETYNAADAAAAAGSPFSTDNLTPSKLLPDVPVPPQSATVVIVDHRGCGRKGCSLEGNGLTVGLQHYTAAAGESSSGEAASSSGASGSLCDDYGDGNDEEASHSDHLLRELRRAHCHASSHTLQRERQANETRLASARFRVTSVKISSVPLTAVGARDDAFYVGDWDGVLSYWRRRQSECGEVVLVKQQSWNWHQGPILKLSVHPRLASLLLTVGFEGAVGVWDVVRPISSDTSHSSVKNGPPEQLVAVHSGHLLMERTDRRPGLRDTSPPNSSPRDMEDTDDSPRDVKQDPLVRPILPERQSTADGNAADNSTSSAYKKTRPWALDDAVDSMAETRSPGGRSPLRSPPLTSSAVEEEVAAQALILQALETGASDASPRLRQWADVRVLDARWIQSPLPEPFGSSAKKDTSRLNVTGLVPGGAVFASTIIQGVSVDDNNLLQVWALTDDHLVDLQDTLV